MKEKTIDHPKEDEQLRWIEATLSNDENSSDENLIKYFVTNGLSEENARTWVSKRDRYLNGALNFPVRVHEKT